MNSLRIQARIPVALLGLFLTACGSTASPAGTGSSPNGSGVQVLQTATATVSGKSETILTDTHGMTLYFFDPDSPTRIACTGGCASTWPPLIATADNVTGGPGLALTLSVLNGANGKQVLANGHPLYTFAQDKAPGDTKGDGLFGKWHVATPDIKAAAAGAASATSRYGY
jgi:predicted lipoprotein with Yx(FWY)xxD motif